MSTGSGKAQLERQEWVNRRENRPKLSDEVRPATTASSGAAQSGDETSNGSHLNGAIKLQDDVSSKEEAEKATVGAVKLESPRSTKEVDTLSPSNKAPNHAEKESPALSTFTASSNETQYATSPSPKYYNEDELSPVQGSFSPLVDIMVYESPPDVPPVTATSRRNTKRDGIRRDLTPSFGPRPAPEDRLEDGIPPGGWQDALRDRLASQSDRKPVARKPKGTKKAVEAEFDLTSDTKSISVEEVSMKSVSPSEDVSMKGSTPSDSSVQHADSSSRQRHARSHLPDWRAIDPYQMHGLYQNKTSSSKKSSPSDMSISSSSTASKCKDFSSTPDSQRGNTPDSQQGHTPTPGGTRARDLDPCAGPIDTTGWESPVPAPSPDSTGVEGTDVVPRVLDEAFVGSATAPRALPRSDSFKENDALLASPTAGTKTTGPDPSTPERSDGVPSKVGTPDLASSPVASKVDGEEENPVVKSGEVVAVKSGESVSSVSTSDASITTSSKRSVRDTSETTFAAFNDHGSTLEDPAGPSIFTNFPSLSGGK